MKELAQAAMKLDKVEITSDGTRSGTKILLNGKPIKNLNHFHFSFFDRSSYGPEIYFAVSDPDVKDGEFRVTQSFSLQSARSDASASLQKATFTAPPAVQSVATLAMDKAKKATHTIPSHLQQLGHALATGQALPLADIADMHAFFTLHDKVANADSRLEYQMLGGKPSRQWVNAIAQKINEAQPNTITSERFFSDSHE